MHRLDPFGHIAAAKHFLEVRKRELSKAKDPSSKEYWRKAIARAEIDIERMQKNEIEFWESFRT